MQNPNLIFLSIVHFCSNVNPTNFKHYNRFIIHKNNLSVVVPSCYSRQFAPLSPGVKHNAPSNEGALCLVPVVGVEPTRYRYNRILSPALLPIPPLRRKRTRHDLVRQTVSV